MRRHRKLLPLLLAPLALLPFLGCGGSSGTSAYTRAPLNVYVTDGFGDAYKQVLVTLYKIELTTDGTTFQTVFSDTAGQTINLSSLSDTAQLLASLNVPAGSYTQARVAFGDHFTLVAKDGTTTSVAVDSSVGTVANGLAVITINTPTKVLANQAATLMVDFKLADFKLVGGSLRPQVACGDGGQLGTKKRTAHVSGTVANQHES